MVENDNNLSGKDDVKLYGKVAKFPKNTKAKNAYNFLENLKISKKKLWYYIIERDYITEQGNPDTSLQMIKYNNKHGVNCSQFLSELKKYYEQDENIVSLIEQLVVDGSEYFSIIRNIPNVKINGEKFINKITKDIIKILYK